MDKKELFEHLGLSEYIAFDFETTGLNANEDRIIEIAAIKFHNGDPVDRFITLINPERSIDPFITDITERQGGVSILRSASEVSIDNVSPVGGSSREARTPSQSTSEKMKRLTKEVCD